MVQGQDIIIQDAAAVSSGVAADRAVEQIADVGLTHRFRSDASRIINGATAILRRIAVEGAAVQKGIANVIDGTAVLRGTAVAEGAIPRDNSAAKIVEATGREIGGRVPADRADVERKEPSEVEDASAPVGPAARDNAILNGETPMIIENRATIPGKIGTGDVSVGDR